LKGGHENLKREPRGGEMLPKSSSLGELGKGARGKGLGGKRRPRPTTRWEKMYASGWNLVLEKGAMRKTQ